MTFSHGPRGLTRPTLTHMDAFLMVDDVSDDVVDVELDSGLRTELPRAWLPADVTEGDGFRCESLPDGGVRFVPDDRAARVIRERNKQTLLDFHDEHDA